MIIILHIFSAISVFYTVFWAFVWYHEKYAKMDGKLYGHAIHKWQIWKYNRIWKSLFIFP